MDKEKRMEDDKTAVWVREVYLKHLLKLRTKTEGEITELGHQEALVDRNDYDETGQFMQEKAKIGGQISLKFAYLKRVNRRIDEINKGTFTAKCRCGKNIQRNVLKKDPDRTLCIKCQKEENGKRK